MRSRVSAGLLMFRLRDGQLEVFLAHPGGPFFANRDDGHWTIPKGEIEPGEEFLATALREFKEEVGIEIDRGHIAETVLTGDQPAVVSVEHGSSCCRDQGRRSAVG